MRTSTRHTRAYPPAMLSDFMASQIENLKTRGRIRTAETYLAALRSFRSFLSATNRHNDIALSDISQEIVSAYEAWMHRRGLTKNTTSFYMRILRAAYNRASERGLTPQRVPFKQVYTGVDRTAKRALPVRILRRIKGMDFDNSPALGYARDIFLLSFYLRGMSFVDMAFLRKADLRHGYVSYRRRKTGSMLTIRWTSEMQSIVDRYDMSGSSYLLPVIRSDNSNSYYAYRNASYNINRALKKIGSELGLDAPLTLYVARHSWASIARSKGIPVSVISESMGHSSEKTTMIYLASLDIAALDKANALVIGAI